LAWRSPPRFRRCRRVLPEEASTRGHTITLDLPSQLAHQARQIEPEIGLLLPCNVVVRRTPAGPWLDALDPQVTPLTRGGRTHQVYRAGAGQAVVVLP
jgi:hypothetical protein